MNAITQIFESQKALNQQDVKEIALAADKLARSLPFGPVRDRIVSALEALDYVKSDPEVTECHCGAFYHNDDAVACDNGEDVFCSDECAQNNNDWAAHVRFYSQPR